jgi:hypothetical protein
MIAKSGTYKLHQTNAAYGTAPKRVKPACGQSVSRSYLSVIEPGTEDQWLSNPITSKCKKCFDV